MIEKFVGKIAAIKGIEADGTGFTKMGFSGNLDPDFVFPTAIAEINKKTDISISSKRLNFIMLMKKTGYLFMADLILRFLLIYNGITKNC